MIMVITMGSDWLNRNKLAAVARQAATQAVRPAEFVKITNYNAILGYPILSPPGLVINEKLVCSGRIPKQSEVAAWLTTGASGEPQP